MILNYHVQIKCGKDIKNTKNSPMSKIVVRKLIQLQNFN